METETHITPSPVKPGYKAGWRRLKRISMIILGSTLALGLAGYTYMQMPQFGKAPSGSRLERIKQSPNYKNGQFQNEHATPLFAKGYSMGKAVYEALIKYNPRKTPVSVIPSVKVDLSALDPNQNVLVWFGHSSYFLQMDGKSFLIDPVFSGNASPIPGIVPAFKGTDIYNADDMPPVDYLIISHDHYDHLDYQTILALKPKIKSVVCGLGVGEHFEYWGYKPGQIIEKDWKETIDVTQNLKIHTIKARHGSGRGLTRDNTLWMSFIIESPSMKIYLGGDSGYDSHFAEIGSKYGPIDLAILENGQYDIAVPYIHMQPEEVLKAASDLKAKRILPVHSSKFVLNRHQWDEPLIRISDLAKTESVALVTPMIGQVVNLSDSTQTFSHWWEGLE